MCGLYYEEEVCEWALQAQHLGNLDPFTPCGTFHKQSQLIANTDRVVFEAPALRARGTAEACETSPNISPALCCILGRRLVCCLCRWVSEQAHPLRVCSHGNSSDSEQLVFVFFGNMSMAGILTGTREVWYAKMLPGRTYAKRMSCLGLLLVCCSIHAEIQTFFHLFWGAVDPREFVLQSELHATSWQAELVQRVHNPQVDDELRFSQMTSG